MIRVVVADDHEVVRAGIVGLLELEDDIQVVGQAGDGDTLVALVAELEPDVVLTDLRMPGCSGAEAARRIISAQPDVRVVVLTMYDTEVEILTAIEAGATGYLLKAAPADEVIAGVRAVAAGGLALSPATVAGLARAHRAGPALSPREREVLGLVRRGRSNPEIAQELYIGEATVKTHLERIFDKLGVNDRTAAVALAMDRGLI